MRALALLVAAAFVFAVALPAGAAESPRKEIARLKRQVAVLQAQVRRSREQKLLVQAGERSQRREQALARRVAAVVPCPVTRANGSQPPGSTFGAEFHGSGALWVGLPPSNVVVGEPGVDGSISEKFGGGAASQGGS